MSSSKLQNIKSKIYHKLNTHFELLGNQPVETESVIKVLKGLLEDENSLKNELRNTQSNVQFTEIPVHKIQKIYDDLLSLKKIQNENKENKTKKQDGNTQSTTEVDKQEEQTETEEQETEETKNDGEDDFFGLGV